MRGVALAGDARSIGAPELALDPFTRSQVELASEHAYREGLAEGRRGAVADAEQQARATASRIVAALEQAVGATVEQVRALREQQALADVELARRIAEAVLGREPHDAGLALLARCQMALAAIDDRPLELRCNPDDAPVIAEGLDGRTHDLSVVEDASLATGEAVISGRWARAELTREAAWALVAQALANDDGYAPTEPSDV